MRRGLGPDWYRKPRDRSRRDPTRLELISAPAVPPITYEAVREHLRLETDDDAGQVGALIEAARAFADGADGWLGRALITQRWRAHYDGFPRWAIEVPLPPLQSVEEVAYLDLAGDRQVIDPADYFVDNVSPGWPGRILPAERMHWPSELDRPASVSVAFTAGFGDQAHTLPNDLRLGLLMLIAHWYENPEPVNIGNIVNALPFAAETLLGRHKLARF